MTQMTDVATAAGIVASVDDVSVPEPGPCVVDLPGGYVMADGMVVRKAEVRELTGLDEEAMARGANKQNQVDLVRLLEIIFERGLIRIGDQEVGGGPEGRALRQSMLVGDKDAVLLGIRIATYGPDYESRIVCPKCGEESDVVFELLTDIEERTLEDPQVIYRTVKLRNGEAEVRLPTVGDQAYATSDPRRTAAEANTMLLARCVRSVNGVPTMGEQTLRAMGMKDRHSILQYIADTAPGPRMGEVKVECPACKEESQMSLSMPALFL